MSSTNETARNNNKQPLLNYHHGFGNHFESEAYEGALPIGRNNPRIVPHGLYAEQLSGTAFTAPRNENRRTWLYRMRPSASGTSSAFRPCGSSGSSGSNSSGSDDSDNGSASSLLPETFGRADWFRDMRLDPNPMRWGATPLHSSKGSDGDDSGVGINFVEGIHTLMGSGDPMCKSGIGIYVYACNTNMSSSGEKESSSGEKEEDVNEAKRDMHMFNSDGDFLIVPQQMGLWIQTELGLMTVMPGEICVIPRGVVFTVNLIHNDTEEEEECHLACGNNNFARGYILEIFRGHFQLPELGPIGSNGLANARDFLHPTAYYESSEDKTKTTDRDDRRRLHYTIVNKFGQKLFERTSPHTPYDVVAWHGNYLPYKYDLRRFCAINSVTYDHPDPSIYTVLTARGGDEEGTALADFVIFPPRVMATDENTFRPPWFHRNVMTEFMGLIHGEYDAKKGKKSDGDATDASGGGFVPGGASLHPIMTPHGPDAESYFANVENSCDGPVKFEGGLAFMFESSAMCRVSRYALECEHREVDYASCWDGLVGSFPRPHT
eukprot:CAMPEP_0201634210 /NCGR_PEP_ID=MMETSP0493-20130528/7234_1 /ASSEMBLY_ACC=CAM_ASM_000838 /TAXON_ID=420259 /ORGANISM="Thalassiosira gravida, Strain GMp14c1" /LENGTH=548 /DNA_ID=CAMNT_0048106037 /DNA_START=104 /DNA_END=1750 /DNA_ORIENTATION=+